MAKVAEHDAKEEGEEDAAEGARVDLTVARGAVRVDERLEATREVGHRDVGRRREAGVELVEDGARVEVTLLGDRRHRGDELIVLARGYPPFCDEDVTL